MAAHHFGRGERVHDLAIVSFLEAALAELHGNQIRGRSAEAQALTKD